MEPYGNRFPYNNNNFLNPEYLNYGYEHNRNYGLMGEPEIPVEEDYYESSNRSNNQMHQMYYHGDRYGNTGYQSPRHGHNYPYTQQQIPFNLNQQIEYPSREISVDIRLSSRYIDNRLSTDLQRREGLSCVLRERGVITVSGFPTNRGPQGFLDLVKDISGDRRASIVRINRHD